MAGHEWKIRRLLHASFSLYDVKLIIISSCGFQQRSSVKKRARSMIMQDRYHFNDATRNATHDFDHLRASFNESWQRGTAGRFLNIFYGSAIKSKRPRANVPRFYRGRRILRRNKAFGFALGNIFIYPLMSCCAIHPRHTPRLRFPNTIAGVYIRN